MAVERNVDLVFCIDGTGSMYDCIDTVKTNAKRFYQDVANAVLENNSTISSLRIKLITFRDYGCDTDAMVETEFFELPADQDLFEEALNRIDPHGGGDGPENGFEALYYAMKSDFYTGNKDRQVIVLFTDAEALDLRARLGQGSYPADMVDMNGLQTYWACMGTEADPNGSGKLRERCKRMILFAPAGTKYEELSKVLNRVIFQPVTMNAGLDGVSFDSIVRIIAASVTSK